MAEVQKDKTGSREDTLRFMDMVGLFGSQAMIALGKVMNPATQKAEKNLPAARLFIDTLEMLEHKTQGNLTADETKLLKATLTDLRFMYVEESKPPAPGSEPAEPKAERAQESEQPPETKEPKPAGSAAPAPEPDHEPKVKFHKKYE